MTCSASLSPLAGHHVQDGKELACGGRQHEPVPDRPVVEQSIPAVKQDADAVEDASGSEQNERRHRDDGDQVIDRDEDGPPVMPTGGTALGSGALE